MKKIAICLSVLFWTLVSFSVNAQDYPRGDVSQDGTVSISDVTCLIDYLLSGTWSDEPITPPDDDDHEWVDLGLPSGTLWATMNVGASAPEEYGDFFAWGETEPKDYYDWSTYKWCYNGDYYQMTKYCTKSEYGYNGIVDDKSELDPEDDAAYVNWGPSCRIPTKEQQRELVENCSSVWTTMNGVNGRLLTGPNGNTLFLPAAGYIHYDSHLNAGSNGYYLSRTLYSTRQYQAYGINLFSEHLYWYNTFSRELGFSVRAVRVPQN